MCQICLLGFGLRPLLSINHQEGTILNLARRLHLYYAENHFEYTWIHLEYISSAPLKCFG